MTIQEMHNWFDILQDKYQSPYFTDDEKDIFLNIAQLEYINSFIDDGEGINDSVERNSFIFTSFSPLVYSIKNGLSMDSNGNVTIANITTELNLLSGDTSPYLYILNCGIGSGSNVLEANYVRHNDIYRLQQNDFKRASTTNPQYSVDNQGLVFKPVDITANVIITVLKEPKKMTISAPSVNSELNSNCHNTIVAIAIDLAGVATREEALISLNQIQKNV